MTQREVSSREFLDRSGMVPLYVYLIGIYLMGTR